MSTSTTRVQNENNLIVTTNKSKFLLGFNEFITGELSTDTSVVEGLVFGQVAASGEIKACDSTATDGSQYPYGIGLRTQTGLDGDTIQLVNKGKIDSSKLTFGGSTTLASTVGAANNLKTIRAELEAMGFILESGVELTVEENYS